MAKKTYSQLLKDPCWQKKRLEVLQRDEFKCLICGDTETQLQVHHTKYAGKPWEVDLEHLKTLCVHCHCEVEEHIKSWKSDGGDIPPFEFFINRFEITKYIGDNWVIIIYRLKHNNIIKVVEYCTPTGFYALTHILPKESKIYKSNKNG